MNPEDSSPPSPESVVPDALTLAVRAFIARVGSEVALERFLKAPGTGPRPLGIERVQRGAAGEAEPTLRMAEVVFDEMRPALPAPPVVRGNPEPEAFTPLPVQPWEEQVRPPQVRQPWEHGTKNRVQQ